MATIDELHQKIEENDALFHDAEMDYMAGDISLEEFRNIRLSCRLMNDSLNYRISLQLARQSA